MASTQDLKAEMLLTSWTDVSAYVYQRDTVTVQRGRQNEASQMQPGQATLTLNNAGGRFTTRNPTGAYYPNLVQNTPLRLSVPVADGGISNYLRFESDSTSSATTPDSAGLQITGVLDVRVDCWPSDYGPVILAAKYGATAKSWVFALNGTISQSITDGVTVYGTGTLGFYWFDGTNQQALDSVLPIPYFGQRICLRVLFTPSTGTAQFYTAPTMAGPFTQLGINQVFGATTLSAGVGQAVQVGGGPLTLILPNSGSRSRVLTGMLGMVYEAQVLAAAVVKADPVFSSQTAGVTSFADAQANTWTLGGTSEISNRLYRFHGEMSSFPKAADPSATDVYSQATAVGITQRLQNSNTPLQSPMRRAYVRLPSSLKLAAYWPCEDLAGAKSLGSALGGPPMQIAGGPTLASNTSFACSLPLPVMNGATFSATIPSGPSFTDADVRFLWAVPNTGEANNSQVIQILYGPGSTIASSTLVYTTGGFLNFSVFNASGGLIHSTGNVSFGVNNSQVRVACDLKQNGGNIDMTVATLAVGATTAGVFTASSVVAGTVGAVTYVTLGSAGITGSAMGHVSVQGVANTIFDIAGALGSWNSEPAAHRVLRLCNEEGINCRIKGAAATSAAMGNQGIDTLMNLLQQCEQTDLGMLYEPRECVGVGYRTRSSMYHQTPLATASYSSAQLYQGFGSTGDTQLTVNDVTATSPTGSTARSTLATGAMSILAPPSGIGRVEAAISPQPTADSQLTQIANWHLTVRSVDDDRYPAIPFQMPRTSTPSAVALLDVGDYLKITGTPSWLPPAPVRQLCAGFAETWFPAAYWLVNVNGIPELPYETAQGGAAAGTAGNAKADTAGAQLTSGITSAATSFSVSTTSGPPWVTAGINFPFDIVVDREQMTVTAISGTLGAPVLVQSKTAAFSTATGTVTLTNATTAGNCLIVTYGGTGGITNPALSALTLGGAAGNFAQVLAGNHTENAAQWADPNCAGGQTAVAYTTTGGSGTLLVLVTVEEWSGIVASSPADQSAANFSASSAATWTSATTLATSQSAELAIGCAMIGSTAALTVTGPGSPWANIPNTSGNFQLITGSQILTAAGTATYSGTASSGGSTDYSALVVTYMVTGQTFTVTRSVNGVVMAHSAGAPVSLYRKPIAAL